MEEAANCPWYLKENEEGVFVKLNEERIKKQKFELNGTSPGGQRKPKQQRVG